VYDFGYDAAGGPEIDGCCVGSLSEEQFGRSIACCAYVCDFLLGGFRSWIVRGPGDAEVGEVGWAGGGGEEDVGGFDVSVDYS